MKLFPSLSLGPYGGAATPKSMLGWLLLMWKIWLGFWICIDLAPTVNGACAAVAPLYWSLKAATCPAPTGSQKPCHHSSASIASGVSNCTFLPSSDRYFPLLLRA